MTDLTIIVAATCIVGIASGLLVYYLISKQRRQKSLTLCPGSMRRLAWLIPHNWFLRRACYYDLTGLAVDEAGLVTCPECGRRALLDSALRTNRRWRPIPIALFVIVLVVSGLTTPFIQSGKWIEYLPDTALVAIEQVGRPVQTYGMQNELESRVRNASLSDHNSAWLASILVKDLHSDKVRYNAESALYFLRLLGASGIPALEESLHSTNVQQRQMAASVLRRIGGYQPTDRMLWVTVEGLREDDLPWGPDGNGGWAYNIVFNARDGTPYIAAHAEVAEAYLTQGLLSDDPQQRYLCAVAAGFGERSTLTSLAAPILIEHLADNSFSEDAKWATPALFHLGPSVRVYLEPLRDSPDEQQRSLAELILLELQGPATTDAQHRHRLKLNTVTGIIENPTGLDLAYWHFHGLGLNK